MVMEKGGLKTSLVPSEVALETCKNLGNSLLEIIKVYYGRGEGVLGSVRIEGWENYEHAKAKGKGVIFITGHSGNWELLALSTGKKAGQLAVVGRPLDNPYLYSVLASLRNKFGNTVIEKRGALRGVLRVLKEGGNVGILMDQAVVPEEGFIIDFLGLPAWTTKTTAIIAKKTQAAVVPLFIKREGGGHKVVVHPEVPLTGDEKEDTKRFSSFIEGHIRENPTEWLWIHRRWKRAGTPPDV